MSQPKKLHFNYLPIKKLEKREDRLSLYNVGVGFYQCVTLLQQLEYQFRGNNITLVLQSGVLAAATC